PGDCIRLAPGTFALNANLTIAKSGTAAKPITIVGTGSTIDGTVASLRNIFITGSYLRLRRVRLTNLGVQAVWCTGMTYSEFDSVEVDYTAQVGIRFKDGSHHNVIQRRRIHDTGQGVHPERGEGIYDSNSRHGHLPLQFSNTDNQIQHNAIGPNVTSQSI